LTPVQGGASSFVDPTAAEQMAQAGRNAQYQGQLGAHNADVANQNSTYQAVGTAGLIAAMMF
jgi:hypothetical protein